MLVEGSHNNIRRLDQGNVGNSRSIWELFQRAYRVEADIVGVEDFPPLCRTLENIQITRSTFTGLFERDTLAAVSETRLVGNCLAIDGFVVDPQFFRKGFGSQLFRFILDETRSDTALVETAAANEPAIRFYKTFGFIETDRWETDEGLQLVKLGVDLRFNQSLQVEKPTAGR